MSKLNSIRDMFFHDLKNVKNQYCKGKLSEDSRNILVKIMTVSYIEGRCEILLNSVYKKLLEHNEKSGV